MKMAKVQFPYFDRIGLEYTILMIKHPTIMA